jgi:Ca2+-binding RTX toxin-like protein
MRSTFALSLIAAGLALPAGVASASTVSVPVAGGPAVFQSGGKASDLVSRLDFTSLAFKDFAQALSAGAGCTAGPPVSCDATRQELHFSPRNDRFRGFSNAEIVIDAGAGKDTLRTAGLWNIVDAGDGADSVWENGDSIGSVHGGAGADKLYSFEAAANIFGDGGDDLLVDGSFSGRPHALDGGDGSDELVTLSSGRGSGAATGGAGADVIVIDTPVGDWTIDAGSGPDTVSGGPGVDTISAGSGNDVIDVTGDGNADDVTCGGGYDKVYADPEDTVAADCEIIVGATPSLPAVAAAREDAADFVAAMPDIPAF